MVKRISRRFVSLLLTFVTILTLLPAMTLPALAATKGTVTGLVDDNIGLSFSGDAEDAWSAEGTTITGSATSTSGACNSTTNYNSMLTITNQKGTKAMLSFGYTIEQNGGTIKVDGADVTAGGSFSKELSDGEQVKVSIKSGSTTATKITITNISLVVATNATVTFQPAKNGSYTVDGETITEDRNYDRSSTTPYSVHAIPDKGYQFLGWYDDTNKIYLRGGANSRIYVSSGNSKVTAIFRAIGTTFQVGTSDLKWDDLNDAIISTRNNSSGYIKQLKSCTISGEYTIPSGVTLLIPFDEAGTLYTNAPAAIRTTPPSKPFRTLTMAANSSIMLENGAAISVGGQYFAAGGGQKGQMVGPYGCIRMESGSDITVKNGASLYAWGFISGNGAVTVQSGGSVYEWYQILDFRGGSATSSMGNKVFPFSQYAVQNVEVPLTLHVGASETVYTAVYAMRKINPTSIPFIGDKGMFKLVSGSLTKAYDGATDRMIYTINGEANLNSLNLKLAGMSVSSSSYVLPLTNNMTVNLTQGSKLTVNQTAALLPGVEVSIAKDAELTVASGKSMYIYDVDEWGKYCGQGGSSSTFIPVVSAPGRTGKREPLADVKVDVNGKLTAIGGIYTTQSGANICSSEGTGKYLQQGAPGTETATYQYDGGTAKHDIPITAAKLKNADGSYVETNKTVAKAGDTFSYCTCAAHNDGTWVPNLKVAAIVDGNGNEGSPYATLQAAVSSYTPDGKNYIKLLHNTAETITADKDLYLDLNGWTVTGDFTMNGHILHGMDSTTDAYDGTNAGKIVGKVSGYDKTYQTGNEGDDAYKRYVAIPGKEENGTPTVSFHRFNISASGYRFELATGDAPKCALFFIGKFQGDKAAKDYLTSLGFTLKDNIDGTEQNYICAMTGKEIPHMPAEGEESNSEVVHDDDGAYLFEAYLMRDIDKENYRTPFTATAQATFGNNGKQSEQRALSFLDAWKSPGEITPEQQAILDKFLAELGITNQTE